MLHMRKRKGPKIEPCGTSGFRNVQEETALGNSILCFRSAKFSSSCLFFFMFVYLVLHKNIQSKKPYHS